MTSEATALANKRNFSLSQQGMTLIEIMLSIVILGIIGVSFTGFFTQSARTTSHSEQMMDAMYIAQTCMEEIINESFEKCRDIDIKETGPQRTTIVENSYSYYVKTAIEKQGELKNVVIKVYKDHEAEKSNEQNPLAQMETLIE